LLFRKSWVTLIEMNDLNLDKDWRLICQFFPSNLDELAKQTGAVDRWRNIKSGEDLLRLCLAYVVEDFSLRSTAGWATRSNWAEMKDTSVLHRVKRSIPFLEAVLAHLLNHRVGRESAKGSLIRIVDATVLTIPGSVGPDWRIHAIYDPMKCRLTRVQVTDKKGGEKLGRHKFEAGDVVVGDRGLAHANGIFHVKKNGGYVLLRMHWQNIRLEDGSGNRLNVEEYMKRADNCDAGARIYVPVKGEDAVAGRLLMKRLPEKKAEEAKKKLVRNASKKGKKPSEENLKLAEYLSIFTTIPTEIASDEAVYEYYRIRWQIELFFKRCKSLLRLNALRADDPELVRAYCTGKLIEIVLVELLATEGETFSPWGVPRIRHSIQESLAVDTHS
jgi:hypothetical protein